MSNQRHTRYFRVVTRNDGLLAMWPVGRQLPGGWRASAFSGSPSACGDQAAELLFFRAAGRAPRNTAGQPNAVAVLLRDIATRHPQAPALTGDGVRLTYAEVRQQAEDLASRLVRWGLRPGGRVAVSGEPEPGLAVALLAALTAGAVCLLPSPGPHPVPGRILLTGASGRERPGHLLGRWTAPNSTSWDVRLEGAEEAPTPTASGGPALVVPPARPRSGPGALWPQSRLIRLASGPGLPALGTGDRVLRQSGPGGPLMALEVLRTLLSGAELVFPPPPARAAPGVTVAMTARPAPGSLYRLRVTTATSSSASCTAPPDGDDLLCAAEIPLPCATVRPGGTEARPLPGTRLYVLDEDLYPLPEGRSGQLYVAGDGVAAGYPDHPELTVRQFLPDPQADDGQLMFRTGVPVRRLGDGRVEFTGPGAGGD